ncbi:MAG TPA: M15 family metallopeptidase [Candidatus Egerieimonas intestinavium]|uniref:M15 family metallopeptidase n=1 Tax=Candidatus Egerieimonas intestinavium TaxID=2840777 RepID=A0A9D1EKQ5_9FIRM|nr:M15 family metallopeptidase [Candidatus Egerieimonas intestinavium]
MSEYHILVNREHPLSKDYVPGDLKEACFPFLAEPGDPKRLLRQTACQAAQKLFTRARGQGLCLWGISGYRSYARQEEIFRRRLSQAGAAHAQAYLAPPGCSEHQTGLALDVSSPEISYELEETFAQTSEGRFLTKHAAFYGFILRYPKGKEAITGYAWEPWHIRYVGRPLALYLSFTGLTLEEYLAL